MSGFFVQRILQFSFALGTGSYGAGTPNKLSIAVASAISGSVPQGTQNVAPANPAPAGPLVTTPNPLAVFQGSIAGPMLTVSSVVAGHVAPGLVLSSPLVALGTLITSVGTGRGGPGTYVVSPSQVVSAAAMVGAPVPSTTVPLPVPQNPQQPGQPLRALVHIESASLPHTGLAQIRIWGMSLDHMNLLSKAGLVYGGRDNSVTVMAGDTTGGMSTIFSGKIIEAYPDMAAQPEASFYIMATPTQTIQLKPVDPISFTGPVPAQQALQSVAASAGLTLENNNVPGVLQAPYLAGTAWQQIRKVVDSLDCFAAVDGVNKVLAAWPKSGNRAGQATIISPATGMVGYPSFQQVLVKVRQVFSPAYVHQIGKAVTVQSQLQAANGAFSITNLSIDLACNIPDGPWFTNLELNPQQH